MSAVIHEPVRGTVPPSWFWALPGIERIRTLSEGLLPAPPYWRLMGIRPAHIGPGFATWTMPASGWMLAGNGLLDTHPIAEAALTGAVTTTLPPATKAQLLTIVVSGFRPTRPSAGNILARGRVVNASRLAVFAEVEIEDPHGRKIGHAAGHARLRPVEPIPPAPPAELRVVEEPVYGTPDPMLRPVQGTEPTPELWEQYDGTTVVGMQLEKRLRPPLSQLHGTDITKIERGHVVQTMPASEWFCRFSRFVCSGQLATFGNETGWLVGLSLLQPGEWFVGLDVSSRMFGRAPADGRSLWAEGTATRLDDESCAAEVRLLDADRKQIGSVHGFGIIIRASERQRRPTAEAKRLLTTLLFTDIVGSTDHLSRLGDDGWRGLLAKHHALVRQKIQEHDGLEVDTNGDGFLVRFDSPARAVACTRAVRDAVRHLGLEMRAGIHTGEAEIQGRSVTGLAVHIAARLEAAAAPGEIIVSSTLRELVTGSGLHFTDRGAHTLKGVPGEWRLYALAD